MSHVWHCQHRLLSGAIWGLPKRHSHHNSSSLACSGLNRSSATFCLKCTQGMEVSLKCGSYFYLAFFFSPAAPSFSRNAHTHMHTDSVGFCGIPSGQGHHFAPTAPGILSHTNWPESVAGAICRAPISAWHNWALLICPPSLPLLVCFCVAQLPAKPSPVP